jgi:Uma2 family endonuclease
MPSRPHTFLTPEEYLEIERAAERKSEYFRGEMFATAGATERHVTIVTNLVAELRQSLKGRPCKVYSTDIRLRVSPSGLYTYPDVMVACGDLQFADDQKDTLLNPVVIVEVLSESTRDYDRGRKFQHYRTLPSLQEYLTIAQDEVHVEHWLRPEGEWRLREFSDLGQAVRLDSISCTLPLAEIYDKVDWPGE